MTSIPARFRDDFGDAPQKKKKEENPFKMPSDKQIFTMREEERRKKREEREKQKNLSVQEKTTTLSRHVQTRLRVDDDDDFDLRQTHKTTRKIFDPSKEKNAPVFETRREKENLNDFVAKKREMFLLQMSLDNKREEIQRLEREAQKEEEELRVAETKLDESAAAFDEFLRQNDIKAAEAARAAEQETKLKQEKLAEIKKLNAQIMAAKSDISKIEDQLNECEKYKVFLDRLTPEEWLEEQKSKLKEGEEMPMYFEKPEQLLNIFTQLEESNLFLIQNMQETEAALEEMRHKFVTAKARMASETETLAGQVEHMKKLIRREADKRDALLDRAAQKESGAQHDLEFKWLSEKVADVYVQCGFDNDANLSTLQMLTNIEEKLDILFEEIESMPKEEVERMEKAKEKARRLRAREEKMDQKRREQEERIRRAQQRAMAAPVKRTGKPVMFRSYLRKKETRGAEEAKRAKEEEDDIREFFTE